MLTIGKEKVRKISSKTIILDYSLEFNQNCFNFSSFEKVGKLE